MDADYKEINNGKSGDVPESRRLQKSGLLSEADNLIVIISL